MNANGIRAKKIRPTVGMVEGRKGNFICSSSQKNPNRLTGNGTTSVRALTRIRRTMNTTSIMRCTIEYVVKRPPLDILLLSRLPMSMWSCDDAMFVVVVVVLITIAKYKY